MAFGSSLQKILKDRHFMAVGLKKLQQTLADIFFDSDFQWLYYYICVLAIKLIYTIFNEVVPLTARNFNKSWLKNSWPLYLNLSNMIKLCTDNWFTKNSKCQQFFEKRAAKKEKCLGFFKDRYFVIGEPININVGVLRDFCGLSKKSSFAIFPKI